MEKSLRVCVLQLLLTCPLTSGSDASHVNISVGQSFPLTVTLPVGEVLVLDWTKAGSEVFFYRDGKIEREDQRVELTEPELKEETLMVERGVMTVTLKDVTLEDTGTYVCKGLVQTSGGKRERFTREVHLSVSESTEGQFAARTDERASLKTTRSDADDVPPAVDQEHLAVASGEDARSETLELRASDGDAPEAADGKHLAVTGGVICAVAVVVCAVAAAAVWKRKTIKDLLQNMKNPQTPDSPPTTPTTPTTPTSTDSSTPLFEAV